MFDTVIYLLGLVFACIITGIALGVAIERQTWHSRINRRPRAVRVHNRRLR